MEGAGVHLSRVIGNRDPWLTDPFLLLDHFGSDRPEDYLAGFPWHPHRGIETVTCMIDGTVEHGDSLGNSGVIGSGDVQWMTAGSGIIHQEMPQRFAGTMRGFQLWVNLPAKSKMTKPLYRDVSGAQIPEVDLGGLRAKVIAGNVEGAAGPVKDIFADPTYLDLTLDPMASRSFPMESGYTVFAYVFEGSAFLGQARKSVIPAGSLVLFGDGDSVSISASEEGARLILVSGVPLREPIAWRGPIVMNTEAELDTAFREFRDGTFIKDNAD
jgi:redox-sensitive bicupin YhaK (pirin superfamily)